MSTPGTKQIRIGRVERAFGEIIEEMKRLQQLKEEAPDTIDKLSYSCQSYGMNVALSILTKHFHELEPGE